MQNSLMIGWHHRCEIAEQEVVKAQKDLEDSIKQGKRCDFGKFSRQFREFQKSFSGLLTLLMDHGAKGVKC